MKDNIYICHISDLHFGIYENKAYSQVDPTFTLPYSFIEFISGLPKNKKPHFLIISGDLTSISEEEEYEQFLQFIEDFIGDGCFSKCNKYSEKDRIIIIPGNHDTVRKLKSGKEFGNDKLESFKNKIVSEGFNTPFGTIMKFASLKKKKKGVKRDILAQYPVLSTTTLNTILFFQL